MKRKKKNNYVQSIFLVQNTSFTQSQLSQQRVEQSPCFHVENCHQTRELCTSKYSAIVLSLHWSIVYFIPVRTL